MSGVKIVKFIVCFACVVVIVSCQDSSNISSGIKEQPVFRIATTFPIKDLHPYKGGLTRYFSIQIYSQLYAFRYKDSSESIVDYDLVPDIVEKMIVMNNSQESIVTLKKDVKFHNGSLLTSKDVEYSFSMLNNSKIAQENSSIYIPSLKVEIIDDYNIRVHAPFPVNWKQVFRIPILSKRYEEGYKGKKIDEYIPMGTGPYKFIEFNKEKGIIKLEPFENYGTELPVIPKLEVHIFPNAEAAIMALFSDKVDYFHILSIENAKSILNHPKLGQVELFTLLDSRPFHLFLNSRIAKLKDGRVRKAISLLIDRKALVENRNTLHGFGVPADTPLHLSEPITKPQANSYNPKKGLELLKKAGYRKIDYQMEKDGVPLELSIIVAEHNRLYLQVLRFIHKAMLEAGIALNIKYVKIDELMTILETGNYEIVFAEYKEYVDLYNNSNVYESGAEQNYTGFSDSEADIIFKQLRSGIKPTIAMKRKIQNIIRNDASIITLFYPQKIFAIKNNHPLSKEILKDPFHLYWFGRN